MARNTNLSPGVEIFERDVTLRIPTVTSSVGGLVVAAEKGPLNVLTTVQNEAEYIDTFGIPDDYNYPHWFTATSFLAASNQLYVVRTEDDTVNCAGVTVGISGSTPGVWPTGKTAGEYGPEGLTYDQVGSNEAMNGSLPVFDEEVYHFFAVGAGPYYDAIKTVVINSDDYATLIEMKEELASAVLQEEVQEIAERYFTGVPATTGSSGTPAQPLLSNSLLKYDVINSSNWSVASDLLAEYTQFEFGPDTSDEIAVLVYEPLNDEDNDTLRETYVVSNIYDKRDELGNRMFGPDVINGNSRYVYFFIDGSEAGAAGSTLISVGKTRLDAGMSFGGSDPLTPGVSGLAALDGEIITQYREHFSNKEDLEVDILLDAGYTTTVKRVLDDLASNVRKDCMAILTVPQDKLQNLTTKKELPNYVTQVKNYVQTELNINSSYSTIYANYFQVFDRFAEKFRWVPVSGYVGAVFANVDFTDAQWFAPAGLNRGIISNINKLAVNPNKDKRDVLYYNRANAIVNFFGQGTVIWGQKTLQGKPSSFDRINVRRLFLHMERSIEKLARFMLFEFNDEFTRARFRNLVNPFLAEIQTRRGIFDYEVRCDETNNTPEVIDRNEFVAEILVKPARAIEFIKLTFTAVATGVEFSEVVERKS